MPDFLDHLDAEILALEQALRIDPRFIKWRELRRVRNLYESSSASSPASDSLSPATTGLTHGHKTVTREPSPETKQVIEEAEKLLAGRTSPVPLRDMYHQLVEIRGCRVGGRDPVNGLSAILSRSGRFVAHGRSGWTLRILVPSNPPNDLQSESEATNSSSLFVTPKSNGTSQAGKVTNE